MFRVNFSVSAKGNNGRLKRLPYEFCFYVVALWVKGSINLYPSAPLGVTFVNRHKSNQKDFASATAQEGIKMTALRGKSRISLPLRLQLSCAKAHLAFGRRFHLQTATASGN